MNLVNNEGEEKHYPYEVIYKDELAQVDKESVSCIVR